MPTNTKEEIKDSRKASIHNTLTIMAKKDSHKNEPVSVNNSPYKGKFREGKEYIIKGKYKLVNYAKGGAFGDVFLAKHI